MRDTGDGRIRYFDAKPKGAISSLLQIKEVILICNNVLGTSVVL